MKQSFKRLALLSLILSFLFSSHSLAQTIEPPVEKVVRNTSTIQSEYDSGFGFNVAMNNFGFGLGTEYRKVVGTSTELMASLRVGGLRDASEQTFTDYFFGQQIIPNKYQRAFAFPLLLGLRHRLFTDMIQEDYRFFVSASIGPAMAFSFPYFKDANENGYREQFSNYYESINDIFSGWSEGDWHLGGTGEVKAALDIGGNFARLNSVEFGYFFYYFPDGIQLMMPNQPAYQRGPNGQQQFVVDQNGELVLEPFFEEQTFFGSPQITFTFGWLW
ncbi:MAG: hypothetical protein R3220_12165 [Balneolaceae bacterium]|nr:hypothetical protein [Balneolaceae bacterium]